MARSGTSQPMIEPGPPGARARTNVSVYELHIQDFWWAGARGKEGYRGTGCGMAPQCITQRSGRLMLHMREHASPWRHHLPRAMLGNGYSVLAVVRCMSTLWHTVTVCVIATWFSTSLKQPVGGYAHVPPSALVYRLPCPAVPLTLLSRTTCVASTVPSAVSTSTQQRRVGCLTAWPT